MYDFLSSMYRCIYIYRSICNCLYLCALLFLCMYVCMCMCLCRGVLGKIGAVFKCAEVCVCDLMYIYLWIYQGGVELHVCIFVSM